MRRMSAFSRSSLRSPATRACLFLFALIFSATLLWLLPRAASAISSSSHASVSHDSHASVRELAQKGGENVAGSSRGEGERGTGFSTFPELLVPGKRSNEVAKGEAGELESKAIGCDEDECTVEGHLKKEEQGRGEKRAIAEPNGKQPEKPGRVSGERYANASSSHLHPLRHSKFLLPLDLLEQPHREHTDIQLTLTQAEETKVFSEAKVSERGKNAHRHAMMGRGEGRQHEGRRRRAMGNIATAIVNTSNARDKPAAHGSKVRPPGREMEGKRQKEKQQGESRTAHGHDAVERLRGSSSGSGSEGVWQKRQTHVVSAFRHAWRGYKAYAFGMDELKPMSRRGEDGLGGLGATIVDALDTAMLMGDSAKDIVKEAGSWIEKHLGDKIAKAGQVNLFETTIRILGGLLSAYHLKSGSMGSSGGKPVAPVVSAGPEARVYLRLAVDLTDRLMAAFKESSTPVPLSDVILKDSSARRATTGGGESSTAECTTLQLEFWELSRLTGDQKYAKAAMKVMEHIRHLQREEGLVPIFIDPNSGHFVGSEIRLGSRGDSYYEYLIKAWLQQREHPAANVAFLRAMFDEAALKGIRNRLVARSAGPTGGLTFVAERPAGIRGYLHPKMDHLVCFLPGTLALAATHGLTRKQADSKHMLSDDSKWMLHLAEELTHTCFEMYNVTATGLAPEIVYFEMNPASANGLGTVPDSTFSHDFNIHPMDRHNLLRPETVESLFYMHRLTHDPKYRKWGWQIFQSFQKYTRVASGGFTSLADVTVVPPPSRDKMETFFLGETLKYFYLLFGDDSLLPLDAVVINTEAHALPITHALPKTEAVGKQRHKVAGNGKVPPPPTGAADISQDAKSIATH